MWQKPFAYVNAGHLNRPSIRHALKSGNAFVTAGYWGPLLFVHSKGKGPGEEVAVAKDGKVPLSITVLSNRPLKGYEDGIRIIQGGKWFRPFPRQTAR